MFSGTSPARRMLPWNTTEHSVALDTGRDSDVALSGMNDRLHKGRSNPAGFGEEDRDAKAAGMMVFTRTYAKPLDVRSPPEWGARAPARGNDRSGAPGAKHGRTVPRRRENAKLSETIAIDGATGPTIQDVQNGIARIVQAGNVSLVLSVTMEP
jgi:hypothetical protein